MGRVPAGADGAAADLVEIHARDAAFAQPAHEVAHPGVEAGRVAAHHREAARHVDVVLPPPPFAALLQDAVGLALRLPRRRLLVPADAVRIGLDEDALRGEAPHGGGKGLRALARRPEVRVAGVVGDLVPPIPVQGHRESRERREALHGRLHVRDASAVPEPDRDVAQAISRTGEHRLRPRLLPGPTPVDLGRREPVAPERGDPAAERQRPRDAVGFRDLRQVAEDERHGPRLRAVADDGPVRARPRGAALVEIPGRVRAVQRGHEVQAGRLDLGDFGAGLESAPLRAAHPAAQPRIEDFRRVRARDGQDGELDGLHGEARGVAVVAEGIVPAAAVGRRGELGRNGERRAAERVAAPDDADGAAAGVLDGPGGHPAVRHHGLPGRPRGARERGQAQGEADAGQDLRGAVHAPWASSRMSVVIRSTPASRRRAASARVSTIQAFTRRPAAWNAATSSGVTRSWR